MSSSSPCKPSCFFKSHTIPTGFLVPAVTVTFADTGEQNGLLRRCCGLTAWVREPALTLTGNTTAASLSIFVSPIFFTYKIGVIICKSSSNSNFTFPRVGLTFWGKGRAFTVARHCWRYSPFVHIQSLPETNLWLSAWYLQAWMFSPPFMFLGIQELCWLWCHAGTPESRWGYPWPHLPSSNMLLVLLVSEGVIASMAICPGHRKQTAPDLSIFDFLSHSLRLSLGPTYISALLPPFHVFPSSSKHPMNQETIYLLGE